jgi:2-phospho-L-lactate transferase/gluconeogenesis factor (CofD/UPF0052 family)
MVRLMRSTLPGRREFVLEVDDDGTRQLLWTFRSVDTGTELSISARDPMSRLLGMTRRATASDIELERTLDLLPNLMSMKVVVIGGGTGLYTTLLALQGRTPGLSAVISGLPRAGHRRDPKDELGALPLEDEGLCLVALAPTLRENLLLRGLLQHRMRGDAFLGIHFGSLLLQALTEIRGSQQAGLDDAAHLLQISGRILLAPELGDRDPVDGPSGTAPEAIVGADMIVIAPGQYDLDIQPVFSSPGIAQAFRDSPALKVVVTKVMSAENEESDGTTSQELERLVQVVPPPIDLVLANDPLFPERQLRAYASLGARPIVPDIDRTARFAAKVLAEPLTGLGDLARHDPVRLGERLITVGSAAWLDRVQ